uniref:Uncharacterized protein n=1 Tax=Octopus bimaculoides TaxID=37653 RepID=A0A0L8IBD9_OCTBM
MSARQCKNDPNRFCYICGELTFAKEKRSITRHIKKIFMKVSYEDLKAILTSIQYDDHTWHICADFKVAAMLTGLQLSYTKFCCILCLWNSRARAEHYVRKMKLSKENTTSSTNHL